MRKRDPTRAPRRLTAAGASGPKVHRFEEVHSFEGPFQDSLAQNSYRLSRVHAFEGLNLCTMNDIANLQPKKCTVLRKVHSFEAKTLCGLS